MVTKNASSCASFSLLFPRKLVWAKPDDDRSKIPRYDDASTDFRTSSFVLRSSFHRRCKMNQHAINDLNESSIHLKFTSGECVILDLCSLFSECSYVYRTPPTLAGISHPRSSVHFFLNTSVAIRHSRVGNARADCSLAL